MWNKFNPTSQEFIFTNLMTFLRNHKNVQNSKTLSEEGIFWRSYIDSLSAKTRLGIISISLIAAFVFLIPAIPNFFRYANTPLEYVFWRSLVVRLFVGLAFLSLPLYLHFFKKPKLRTLLILKYIVLAVWISFWVGIFYVGTTMPDIPERSSNINQLFFGMFGALFIMTVFFDSTLIESLFYGLATITVFLTSHLMAKTLEPANLISYSIFLIGTTIFVAIGQRTNNRLRRNDFVLRTSLGKANSKLKELDQVKTKFFSNVSHELRTPLTLILGPVDSILSGTHEPTREYMESIRANAHRLLRQVNLLLDFSKVEAGKMVLNLSVGNVGDLLQQLAKAAKPQTERMQIHLVTEGLENVGLSQFDHNKIETIAANLISNALKFTPAGGTITIRAGREDQNIFFEIQDTGHGIPEEQFKKLFQRFSQLDDSATRKTQGTGLGLAMSRDFAILHGGDIKVESQIGKGTTFRVQMPIQPKGATEVLTESTPTQNAKSTTSLAPSTVPTFVDLQSTVSNADSEKKAIDLHNSETQNHRGRRRHTILFTDDNADLRMFVTSLLEPDYNIFLAVNGRDGLEKVQKYKPDLILSDLMMPEMTGMEFCQKIKESNETNHIPFVLLTAKGSMDSKIEGLSLGADDYLNKPFSEPELKARLKNIIALRETQIRLKKELQSAKAIQMACLPPFTQEWPETQLSVLYHPCEELSGDSFDTVKIGQWIYFHLSDVTSHGTASAQVTYVLKNVFHSSLVKKGELPLDQLLLEMSQRYATYQLPYDVSLVMARYSLETRALEIAHCGSPQPVAIRHDGTKEVLGTEPSPQLRDTPAQDTSDFHILTTKLEAGDRVYFYTDGSFEFQAGERSFGQMRLHQAFSKLSSEEWSTELLNVLSKANKSPQFEDDITIVRLKL